MANTDGIADVTREDDVIAGRASGGLTSQGETVNVYLQADDARSGSTISVWAEGGGGFVTSDPWKYRNAFAEELRALRDRPQSELPPGPDAPRSDGESAVESGGDDSRNENAVVWMAAGKVLLVILGIMLLVMGLVTAVALL